MDFENMNIWCWILFLAIGILGLTIGYYWGKGKNEVLDNSNEINALEDKNTRLKTDSDASNKKLVATPVAAVAPLAFDAGAAKAAFGKRVKQDDLKVVEGIGPKIEGLFHNFDIKTWESLSEATVARCNKVLESGGKRYQMHDPASWPMQAKMAFKGDWKKLAKWQDQHKAGRL